MARFVLVDHESLTPVAALRLLLTHEQYIDHYQTADSVAGPVPIDIRIAAARAELRTQMQGDSRLAGKGRHAEYMAALDEPVVLSRVDAIHGPYPMDVIGVETFDQLDGVTALASFDDWLSRSSNGVPPVERVHDDLGTIRNTLAAAEVAFRLRDLGEQARHEAAFVLGDYEELAVINLGDAAISLVAAGYD